MAIARLKPDVAPPIQTTLPDEIEAPSKSIFTELVPESKIHSLLKYIEGYPWTVNYYGQILNKNNTVENFDPTTPNLTQPYYLIVKLVLQVSSPLTSSYDQATGVTVISGTAVTPYSITPNVGDIFLSNVDSGEDAIFHITSVSRKTHRKDTLYEISYNLYSYTSQNPDLIQTLEERLNETYYFNPDTNFFNRDILVKPSVKEATDRLKFFLEESQSYYFLTFPQKHTGSILIPGVDETIYDPNLINFITSIVDYNTLIDVRLYRHSFNDSNPNQKSILDLLISRSKNLLPVINKKYAFLPSKLVANKIRFGTVHHAGIKYIAYPVNKNTDVSVSTESIFNRSLFLSEMRTSKNYNTNSPIIIKTKNNDNIYNKPLLHSMFEDDYYVVSENFYTYLNDKSNYENISYIELLIYRFLNNEAIAKEDLVVGIESYMKWNLLSQLYILPVMWLIVKSNL